MKNLLLLLLLFAFGCNLDLSSSQEPIEDEELEEEAPYSLFGCDAIQLGEFPLLPETEEFLIPDTSEVLKYVDQDGKEHTFSASYHFERSRKLNVKTICDFRYLGTVTEFYLVEHKWTQFKHDSVSGTERAHLSFTVKTEGDKYGQSDSTGIYDLYSVSANINGIGVYSLNVMTGIQLNEISEEFRTEVLKDARMVGDTTISGVAYKDVFARTKITGTILANKTDGIILIKKDENNFLQLVK